MSKSLWETDDSEWMDGRLQEWAYVKANLDLMDPIIPRRSQRFHKELFFEGKIDPVLSDSVAMNRENIKEPFDHCLILFRMWYLPENNLDSFREVFEEETELSTLNHCRSFMFNPFPLSTFTTDYGMFGGREEQLIKVFVPGLDYKEAIVRGRGVHQKFSYALTPNFTLSRCATHTTAVLSNMKTNPYAPGQYLWDHLAYSFEHYPDKCFDRDLDVVYLRRCLRRVLDWGERADAPVSRETAVLLQKYLYERFESGEFPEPLLQFWEEEKLAWKNDEPCP